MAIEITLPRLGWSMEEGAFSAWLKNHGDRVEAGEPLFSVESDKVTMDVESLDSGILYLPADAPQTGAVVRVGQLLGYLLAEGEAPPAEAGPVAAAPVVASSPAPAPSPIVDAPVARRERAPVTPRARRVAAELGVDTAGLIGTGRGGRVRASDVLVASQAGHVVAASREQAAQPAAPITALRRTIADRMVASRQNTAPVTLTCLADATELVDLRNRWKVVSFETPAPSHTDIVVKLAATALRAHPSLAGRWESDRIVLPTAIHVGIAVDTEHGLVVPVIRDVHARSLAEVSAQSRELIYAARARRLRAEELQGGVFTVSNLGGFGIDAFTPIINYPETAVLGLGAIRKEAVVLPDGQIAARDRITLSLTFDHRVVDGAPAARFLQALVRLIEEPPAVVTAPDR